MDEKTIAIRVPPSVHQTLVLLAKVAGTSLADQLREAIDEHIVRKGSDVDLRELAQSELAQIDAESEDRKKAIQRLKTYLEQQPEGEFSEEARKLLKSFGVKI